MNINDDRIITSAERGIHIQLTCCNHPNMRWSTKNIAPIGCRTIFYNLRGDQPAGMVPECSCSIRDLAPVKE